MARFTNSPQSVKSYEMLFENVFLKLWDFTNIRHRVYEYPVDIQNACE